MSTCIETYKLEKLFGESKNKKTKEWEIWVERFQDYSEIVTSYGYENKVVQKRRIDKGKNIGKSNATSHFEQAVSEAKSKWNKKHDTEQYRTKASSKEESSVSRVEPKLPMLAQDFGKHKNKVIYPCFVQPKLDGYRMIYDSSHKTITTRQGKDFDIVKKSGQLYDELCSLPKEFILDGELYVKGVSFESLGVLRKKTISDLDKDKLNRIEYHVYDLFSSDPFVIRTQILEHLIASGNFTKIKFVPTTLVKSEDEIKHKHVEFVTEGFEGTMVRNGSGKYLEKNRSYDLLKFKDFMDAEFPIVGYTFEKDTGGDDKNCIVWIVQVSDEITCKVRPKGDKAQRQRLYEECENDFSKYKGRNLWTKFFDYTEDGSLRFPSTKTEDVSSYIRDEML